MMLLTMRNCAHEVSEDMEDALNWFCHECQVKGIPCVTVEEVKAFLRDEEGRPDLADQFTSDLLIPLPEGAR